MTSNELQLIMAALDSHREEVRRDLEEMKKYVKCEVGKHTDLVKSHEKRFNDMDAIGRAAAKIITLGGAILGGLWAIITFAWRH